MYSRESLFSVIKAFTGQQNTLVIPRELIHFLGDINAALLLSQLIYWDDKGGRDGWVYKTYAEWQEELSLTKYQVMRAADRLKREGLLDTKVKKANGSPTVHYKLDWQVLSQSFVEFLDNGKLRNSTLESEETAQSLTKITTKTTSKTTYKEDIPYLSIIEHLNLRIGAKFRSDNKQTQQLIKSRWNEGYRLREFLDVIDNQVMAWANDPKMRPYLRPQTLFSPKFESYLQNPHMNEVAAGEGTYGAHRSEFGQSSGTTPTYETSIDEKVRRRNEIRMSQVQGSGGSDDLPF